MVYKDKLPKTVYVITLHDIPIYVGSTTINLRMRLSQHKKQKKLPKEGLDISFIYVLYETLYPSADFLFNSL